MGLGNRNIRTYKYFDLNWRHLSRIFKVCFWKTPWRKFQLLFLFVCLLFHSRFLHPLARAGTKHGDGKTCLLMFDVCGGFTNQILSISFATTVAVQLRADYIVLPSLYMKGIQRRRNSLNDKKMEFGALFDLFHFSSILFQHFGITAVTDVPTAFHQDFSSSIKVMCASQESLAKCFLKVKNHGNKNKIVHMECPFLSEIWDVNFLLEKEHVFNSMLAALKGNENITSIAESIKRELLRRNGSGCLNALHLRIEKDWELHCSDYATGNQIDFFDCFVMPSQIFAYAQEVDFFQCSIYLMYDAGYISESMIQKVEEERLKLPVKTFIFDELTQSVPNTQRETRAAVDSYISMKYAAQFMGNSISTFSALIIRNRRLEGKWAAQYNRGEIPLAKFIPGYRLPWIFSVRGKDEAYDYMVRAALRSAKLYTTLIPYCIIHPDEIYYERTMFLREQGVHIIIHKPDWEDRLMGILETTTPEKKARSHLYENSKAVLGTYARLDIPRLIQLLQYEHYLYTDTDVYFRKEISYSWQNLIFPTKISMGYEDKNHFPMNAGVIFASLPFMRKTYDGLIKFVLSKNSIDHGHFGPGDQGALNEYYNNSLQYLRFLDDMNVKPYKPFRKTARIVHFHGPKPHDYLEFIRTGRCRFNKMCSRGLNHAVCKIFSEWIPLTDGHNNVFGWKAECEIAMYCASWSKLQRSLPFFKSRSLFFETQITRKCLEYAKSN